MNTEENSPIKKSPSPWEYVYWNFLFIGLGHIFAGKPIKGIIFLTTIIGLTGIVIVALGYGIISLIGTIPVIIILMSIYIYSFIDVYIITKSASPRCSAKPWLASFLSYLIPGLGQLFNNSWFKAFGIFTVLIIAGIYNIGESGSDIISYIIQIIACVDAYSVRYKKCPDGPDQSRLIVTILIVQSILIFISATLIREYLMCAYYVPNQSMEPAIMKNDRVFVAKAHYRLFDQPQPGNIIVFRLKDTQFVKRLIGKPGDKIEIIKNELYVNDKISSYCNHNTKDELKDYQFGPIVVPKGEYFVLGDNLVGSYDSRTYGCIPDENVVGKVTSIYWPLKNARRFSD